MIMWHREDGSYRTVTDNEKNKSERAWEDEDYLLTGEDINGGVACGKVKPL